jgi:hypothetical protein
MNAINVKKSELLAVLRQNRAQHRKIFLEAQTGYRQQVIDELDSMLRDARDGKKIRRSVTLIEPVDQTADYDRAIRMMEMSVDDVIQLEEHEFNSYVLDNWSWQKKLQRVQRPPSLQEAACWAAPLRLRRWRRRR